MHDRYKIEILEDFKSGVVGLWVRDKELISRLVFLRSLHQLLIWNKSEGVGTVRPLFHLGLEGSLVELAGVVI